ncbi:hypothetical protein ACFORJ_07845 [Corynebacterium hansenii]|uniref:Head-to-tail stopper n=1 Tax=Corynebacterium hansenii TaxID=394964 RepID=A0ABV7ZPG2_9CORY|nr:hypothetical protein [Corynebacterium hansenii]WJZ00661.1 hypothetical protein CHAN_10300 [Corynebacterium hansenii]
MVSATVLFQPGWIHRKRSGGNVDPVTGNDTAGTVMEIPGTGLVQAPLWTGVEEVSGNATRDERLVMFLPGSGVVGEINDVDEMVSPEGHVWQCISDGMPRGIPGHPPEYTAVRVRRAKEKK